MCALPQCRSDCGLKRTEPDPPKARGGVLPRSNSCSTTQSRCVVLVIIMVCGVTFSWFCRFCSISSTSSLNGEGDERASMKACWSSGCPASYFDILCELDGEHLCRDRRPQTIHGFAQGNTNANQPSGRIAIKNHQTRSSSPDEIILAITHSVSCCAFSQQWRCFARITTRNTASTVITNARPADVLNPVWRANSVLGSTCSCKRPTPANSCSSNHKVREVMFQRSLGRRRASVSTGIVYGGCGLSCSDPHVVKSSLAAFAEHACKDGLEQSSVPFHSSKLFRAPHTNLTYSSDATLGHGRSEHTTHV